MSEAVYWTHTVELDDGEERQVEVTVALEGSHADGWEVAGIWTQPKDQAVEDELWADLAGTLDRAVGRLWE